MGGIHLLIGRKERIFGIVAAAVPAMINGVTWPKPKLARKKIPVIGFPVCAIQASNTAKTGVVQGDDARPNTRPVDIGASDGGTFLDQIDGSGLFGN